MNATYNNNNNKSGVETIRRRRKRCPPMDTSACWLVCLVATLVQARAILPGATQTINGYDVEGGIQPICWKSVAATENETGIPFPNPLVHDFRLANEIEVLKTCPTNNSLQAIAPIEALQGIRLRTGRWYNHYVRISLDLTSLGAKAFVSDETTTAQEAAPPGTSDSSSHHRQRLTQQQIDNNVDAPFIVDELLHLKGNVSIKGSTQNLQGSHRVAVRLHVCKQGAGFCSPFLHDDAINSYAGGQSAYDDDGVDDGGKHYWSPAVFVTLEPADGPAYEFVAEVPLMIPKPGRYFVIAGAQLFISNTTDGTGNASDIAAARIDMANALIGQQRLARYQLPAKILTVSRGVRIASYVVIGLVGSILVWLLFETLRYRNHQILVLSQGSFLIVYLLAGLTSATTTFMLDPRSDLYCRLGAPLILCCMQLFWAITIGRLWRINAVISPLLRKTLSGRTWEQNCCDSLVERLSVCMRFAARQLCCGRDDKETGWRRQVTPLQLACVVALITLPQVLLQLLGVFLQPRHLIIDFNEDMSVGRAKCSSDSAVATSFEDYGFYLLLVLIVALLLMAQKTNSLPSLFNETRVIFRTSLSSLLIILFGIGIIVLTSGPTSSPSIQYVIWIVLILTMTLQSALLTMLPKFRMVWNDESVLVSRLVTDHAKDQQQKKGWGKSKSRKRVGRTYITGLTEPSATLKSSTSGTGVGLEVEQNVKAGVPHSKLSSTALAADDMQHAAERLPSNRHLVSSNNRILVSTGETPARMLVLDMVDLQVRLARVNERILCGLPVSQVQWDDLREAMQEMGHVFQHDVRFEWDSAVELAPPSQREESNSQALGISTSIGTMSDAGDDPSLNDILRVRKSVRFEDESNVENSQTTKGGEQANLVDGTKDDNLNQSVAIDDSMVNVSA